MSRDEPRCPHSTDCAMYRVFKLQCLAQFWIDTYCTAEFQTCARYQAAQRGEEMAPTLLPNGQDLGVAKKGS